MRKGLVVFASATLVVYCWQAMASDRTVATIDSDDAPWNAAGVVHHDSKYTEMTFRTGNGPHVMPTSPLPGDIRFNQWVTHEGPTGGYIAHSQTDRWQHRDAPRNGDANSGKSSA